MSGRLGRLVMAHRSSIVLKIAGNGARGRWNKREVLVRANRHAMPSYQGENVDSHHVNQSRKLFAGRRILSHIDLRVRERARALEFYDAIFAPLGIVRSGDGSGTGEWVSYDTIPESDDYPMEWFAFTVDRSMTAGPTRIAFHAATRQEVEIVAVAARRLCVEPIEGPEEIYGYYAVFFLDPDGNRLEVCCLQ